jgi:mono/diheme cytochrome c family protein
MVKTQAFIAFVILAVCTIVVAQQKEIKHVRASQTSAASGKEMYISYCAVCHGKDAKGGGPAADALKVPPSDLTLLAQKNDGKYPYDRVTSVLRGQANLAAHGNEEMPVWGHIFWKMSGGHEGEVSLRVTNLNKYLESLQAK